MIRFGCGGQFLRGRIWERELQDLASIYARVEIELLILHGTLAENLSAVNDVLCLSRGYLSMVEKLVLCYAISV